jgi:hypothetical protein
LSRPFFTHSRSRFQSKKLWRLRLRDSYQGIVYPWIRLTNPWICIISWSRIRTPKKFANLNPYCFEKIGLWIWFVITDPANFKNLTRFHKSNVFLQIFSTVAQNKSLKIWICDSPNPYESGFVDSQNQTSNYPFCGFVSKKKNPIMLVLYWFVGIRLRIPHP